MLGRRVDPTTTASRSTACRSARGPASSYYLLNKPAGVVTTADDPQGRARRRLVPAEPRVFPVGRLDQDTEGLLLLTNDGDLTHRLTHPSFGVEKEYLAEVEGRPSRGALRRLREGVELDDGMHRAGAGHRSSSRTSCASTIHEGRNRQVRRMCEAVGHPVVTAGADPHRPDHRPAARARRVAAR